MNTRFLQARATLAWAAAKRSLLRLMVGRGNGRRWLAALAAENLRPTPATLWSAAEPATRCIACGICDSVADGEPSALMAGQMRRPQDVDVALDKVRWLREHAEGIARVCPVRASPAAIADMIDAHAALRSDT